MPTLLPSLFFTPPPLLALFASFWDCQAVLFPLLYLKLGFFPDLFFSAVFGGGPAGLFALRTDAVGKFARDAVGGTTNLALSNFVIQAEEIDNEYRVTHDAQQRIRRQIDQLSRLQDKVNERRRDNEEW